MSEKESSSPLHGFGIDIGGSGIKGALVDLHTGNLIGERIRIETPQPATPDAVAAVVAEITHRFQWKGPIGITLPSVIQQNVARTAANIDPSWININTTTLFSHYLPEHDITVMNDADAAGLGELTYGAAKNNDGLVIMLTFGTGIGSAIFYRGTLIPNTELGHFPINTYDAEAHASSAVRKREKLSWKEWAQRVSEMITTMERFLWPDLIIAGGGISQKHEKWMPKLTIRTPIVPAELRNHAGIVGVAYAAANNINP